MTGLTEISLPPPLSVGLTFLYDRDGGFILHKNLVAWFVYFLRQSQYVACASQNTHRGTHYIDKGGTELTETPLPLSPECWYYKGVPLSPAFMKSFNLHRLFFSLNEGVGGGKC